VFDISEEHS
jgi:hypothetical protein